jgi:pimeloyl-ACP methyl ester carboxylesterase
MWRDLIGPLAESHRVICPDLRGFGWTDAPPGGYDPEVFAGDVLAALDAVGVDGPFDLVGHDWGGWTAQMLALLHPQRVRSLVALNIYHPFLRASAHGLLAAWRFWYQWVLATPGFGPRVIAHALASQPVVRWVGSRQAPWTEEETEIYLAQFQERPRAEATSLLYRHSVTALPRKVLSGRYRHLRIEAPGLYLFGTADNAQDARLMPGFERNAPNMRLELVEGVGHFTSDERPELVLDRIRETVARA